MKPSAILARTRALLSADRRRQHDTTHGRSLTGLPLYPATDSRLHLGNDPTRLPESNVLQEQNASGLLYGL